MVDMLKKFFFTGMGVAYMTKEKVEELGKRLVKEAQLSEAEGKKFLDELQKNSEDTRSALERMVREYSEAAMKKMNLPTRKEMEELQRRVTHLENELLRKGQA
jgi:polyhydroxyalkanoate synthesis regulator phasin